MKFKINKHEIIGIPDPSGWVEVHDFIPASDELLKSKGHLLMLISMLPLNGAVLPEKQNLIVGREILARFHESYYNQNGNPFNLLAASVEKVSSEFSSPNVSLQIVAGIFFEEKIILASCGNVECWVLRNGNLAKILSSGTKTNSASGFLQSADVFFLGTSAFFEEVTPDVLKSTKPLESVIEKPKSTVGAVTLSVEQDEYQNVPQIQNPIQEHAPVLPSVKKISPIRILMASLIDKILLVIPQKKIFVREDLGEIKSNKQRKVATSAGAILLVLLILSIFFGIRQQKISTSRSQYDEIINTVQHNLNEANNLASIDPVHARSLVLEANQKISPYKNNKVTDARITKLINDVEDAIGKIAGIYSIEPNHFLDLTLQTSGFKGDDMAASDNRMVVLDKANKRLISVDIDTSKTATVAGPDIMPSAYNVAAYSQRNFISSNDGIWEVGNKAERRIETDVNIGNSLISAYTGNFYILDKANSVIWRYNGDGGNFGTKGNWFGAGIKPDLSNIISWTIDGNIWLLSKSGKISKFSSGSPIDFSLKNVDKESSAKDIFTTQDSKYLYILDPANGRVVVVDKTGEFKAQYVSDNIKNATKIVVSESSKKIILLEGSNLYSLDIKHL